LEQENIKEIVVDTYALLAIVYDEVSENAKKVLEAMRRGEIKGLIPVTVAYEYIIHWLRGRIPGLKSIEEVTTYLKNYFKVIELSYEDYVEAAKIKIKGDMILRKAEDKELRSRRLSIVDSTVIALALKRKTPILTGDKDLAYVAMKENIGVIW